MAEISKFFNSAPGDPRTYQASDFADYFGSVLSTGLLHTDNIPALEVKCDGNGLRTYVTPGKAIIQGYLYENTSNLYLEHAFPEPTLDRIDRIVLRLDKRNQSRYIKLFVKQGTPSANPVPPDLQRDDFIYELSLAQIRVRANTSTLNPADLIDERLDENLCGLVHSLISIPTSQFQAQWDLYFNAKKDEINAETLAYEQELANKLVQYETDFNAWFADIQDTGFASSTDFNAHKAEKATLTKLGHVNHGVLTATIGTNWSGSEAPYTQTISVSGILATDNPIIDIVMSGNYSTDESRIEAWGHVYRAVTSDGSITFYAAEIPQIEIPIQIKVVR